MPIKRPDEYQHNNPKNALVDSSFVRGGARRVANLAAMYALSSDVDQLKERVSRVWVDSESKFYILTDINNVGSSAGWEIDATVLDSNHTHNQLAPASTWSITHNLGRKPSFVVIDSGGTQCIGEPNYVSDDVMEIIFSSAFGGTAYLN